MSEEQIQQTENNTPVNDEIQVDPFESQAREQGWKPKEEYDGDPDKWKPAKEFVERGELFGKIDHLGRELKETKKALKMLQEHHTKVKGAEYNRAIQELKALQKKHLEEGDSDGYLETTELLTDLKAEQKAREVQAENQPKQNVPDQRFVSWVESNSWYTKDQEMREYADTVGLGYAAKNPGVEPEDVLKFVTAQVKKQFSTKFENPKRNQPSAVEGGGSPAGGNKRDTFELTPEERKVMHTFIRSGVMTEQEYVTEVKKLRGTK
jgi:hypothetical protein